VLLSDDYFSVPDDQIKNLTSVLTIVGGRVVYGSDEFSGLSPKIADPLPSWSPVKYFGGYHFGK
jgi:hypothetical protein